MAKVYEKEAEEFRYMCSTLKRYHDQNIHLNTLKFHVVEKLTDNDARNFDECVKLAAKKRLTSLDLESPRHDLDLPEAVFGVKSLVELRIGHCRLPPERITKVSLPNLRELCLETVDMSKQIMLENMIKGCPSIETLIMRFCSFSLDNPRFSLDKISLGTLKRLELQGTDPTVEGSLFTNFASMYPIVCANLFNNFARKFPKLEYLFVGPSLGTAIIDLFSPSLKEIHLYVNDQAPLKNAYFDVPNIASFTYTQNCRLCDVLPKLSIKRGKCIAQIKLKECTDDIQGSWISRQKQFFAQLNMPYESCIEIDFPDKVHLNADHWMTARSDLSFPPAGIIKGIQNIKITQPYDYDQFPLSFARAILNAIFLNFRPQQIIFHWKSDCGDFRVEHNVKFPWDAATNSPTPDFDEILKLLESDDRDRVDKERGLNIVFNLA